MAYEREKASKTQTGATVETWNSRLLATGNPGLANLRLLDISEDKAIGKEAMEEMGLPQYQRNSFTPTEYHTIGEQAFAGMETTLFVASVTNADGNREREIGLTQEDTKSFLTEVTRKNPDAQSLYIEEYQYPVFTGNITISPYGRIKFELAESQEGEDPPLTHAKFVSGKRAPNYRVVRDNAAQSLTYLRAVAEIKDEQMWEEMGDSPEEIQLKTLFFSILLQIPHENISDIESASPQALRWKHGYFELDVVKKGTVLLKTKFLDYKEKEQYIEVNKQGAEESVKEIEIWKETEKKRNKDKESLTGS